MARRILNRKELRADYDAAEKRTEGAENQEEEVEEEEDDDEAEEDEEAPEEEASDEEDADSEEAPVKKRKPAKAKAKPKPKAKAKPRRTAKITRVKVVWGVFNNSNQRVAVFDYPKRQDAYDLATKLTTDKKTTHFVQPVKEPMEDKEKEKEK